MVGRRNFVIKIVPKIFIGAGSAFLMDPVVLCLFWSYLLRLESR